MEKNKKTIKMDILEKFRELEEEAGSILPNDWLQHDYFDRLTTYEKQVFQQAAAELASIGLVEYDPGIFPELKLTQKGEYLLFYGK
jgi:hypothetical protein